MSALLDRNHCRMYLHEGFLCWGFIPSALLEKLQMDGKLNGFLESIKQIKHSITLEMVDNGVIENDPSQLIMGEAVIELVHEINHRLLSSYEWNLEFLDDHKIGEIIRNDDIPVGTLVSWMGVDDVRP